MRIGTVSIALLLMFVTPSCTSDEQPPPNIEKSREYEVRKMQAHPVSTPPESLEQQLEILGFSPASEAVATSWQEDRGNDLTNQLWVRTGTNGGRLVEIYNWPSGRRELMLSTLDPIGQWKRVMCAAAPDLEKNASLALDDFENHLRVILEGKVEVRPSSDDRFSYFYIGPMFCWGLGM